MLDPEHLDVLESMSGMGLLFWKQKNYVKAEEMNRQILELCTKVLRPWHKNTLTTKRDLIDMLDSG